MPNIQITHGLSLNDARSESNVVVNPNNLEQIVAVSRKCKDIAAYDFTSATVYSNDGGITWADSADLATPGWTGVSDPVLTWDDSGNVFLVCVAITNPPAIDYVGIAVYKSTDGGQTWSAPNLIHATAGEEKPWVAGDSGSVSFPGRVYAVWVDGSNMRFARTLDHGNTWIGLGSDPPGGILDTDTYSPEINVAQSGTIYIAYRGLAGSEVKMTVSKDGGDSFNQVATAATGITTLESSLQPWKPNGWPVLPGGTFRVFTLPTACVFGATVVVAWADYREGVSRIYYALSANGGASWLTGPSGQPLLRGVSPANFQHFHPQIVTDPNGVIGCAFYEFGPKPSTYLIDVIMAQSFDGGASFSHFTVTDQPWDPTINAPVSLVDPIASFIGDYMGLDASTRGFLPLWTDTRTGIQELFTAIVPTMAGSILPGIIAQIIAGVVQDGGGLVFVGGHIVRIPPWNPEEIGVLNALGALSFARNIPGAAGRAAVAALWRAVGAIAEQNAREI